MPSFCAERVVLRNCSLTLSLYKSDNRPLLSQRERRQIQQYTLFKSIQVHRIRLYNAALYRTTESNNSVCFQPTQTVFCITYSLTATKTNNNRYRDTLYYLVYLSTKLIKQIATCGRICREQKKQIRLL